MLFDNFVDERKGVKSSFVRNQMNKRHNNIRTLKENVFKFKFLLHSLNHITNDSYSKDGFLIIMNQTITNNAIMATTNHPLSPLRGGPQNLAQRT